MQQIYPQVWINLPKETRLHLVKVFSLIRTGVTEIRDQEVISDGFTVDDLKHISLEKMCEYIGSQESFGRAWEITLAKVHSELNPPMGQIKKNNGEETEVDIVEKLFHEEVAEALKDAVGIVGDAEVAEVKSEIKFTAEEIKAPWCNSCDSKGVRHKLGCPHYTPTK